MRRRNRVCGKSDSSISGVIGIKLRKIRFNRKGRFGLIRSNRKGQFEHMHSIFYTIFTAIMIIFSIVVLTVLASSMDVTTEYNIFNLKYNNVVSRLLYSSKCFATEEVYTGALGPRYVVRPAVIDMAKVNASNHNSCLEGISKGGGKDYNFAIAKLAAKDSGGGSSDGGDGAGDESGGGTAEGDTDSGTAGDESISADAVFEINYISGAAANCKITGWKRTGTYFIMINEGGNYSRGIMRFCMNKL